jgi:iron complex transport system ATP-binding protein
MELIDLSYIIGNQQILDNLNIAFSVDQTTLILGPNGSGKTTLFKVLSGLVHPSKGLLKWVDGSSWNELNEQNRAYLSQHSPDLIDLSVEEVVNSGRYPFRHDENRDQAKQFTKEALLMWDLKHLQQRKFNNLSGGEKQRVHLARVWNQLFGIEARKSEVKLLLLDEPFTYLDLKLQYELLKQIQILKRKQKLIIVLIDHGFSNALSIADQIVFLKEGKVIAAGPKNEVFHAKNIERAFETKTNVKYFDQQYYVQLEY